MGSAHTQRVLQAHAEVLLERNRELSHVGGGGGRTRGRGRGREGGGPPANVERSGSQIGKQGKDIPLIIEKKTGLRH